MRAPPSPHAAPNPTARPQLTPVDRGRSIYGGKFQDEIVPLTGKDKEGNPIQHAQDQGVSTRRLGWGRGEAHRRMRARATFGRD